MRLFYEQMWECAGASFAFSIYDFEGVGKIDAYNLGDVLRALNSNPILATIEKLGGTKKKGEKTITVSFIQYDQLIYIAVVTVPLYYKTAFRPKTIILAQCDLGASHVFEDFFEPSATCSFHHDIFLNC